MSEWQIVGASMVGIVLIGMFAATTYVMGWRASAALWLFSLAATAFVAIGTGLLTGDLP